MKLQKPQVQAWLDKLGKDRRWLAEQIGTTYLSLNQYMSKGFPDWAEKHVLRLMSPPKGGGIELTFTDSEFETILAAMRLSGYTSRQEFYQDAIVSAAASVAHQQSSHLNDAEVSYSSRTADATADDASLAQRLLTAAAAVNAAAPAPPAPKLSSSSKKRPRAPAPSGPGRAG